MSVLAVLEASAVIMAAIDPSPRPALTTVYTYPNSEQEPIKTPTEDDFPFGIALEALMLQPVRVNRMTQAEYERTWLMEWLIFVGPSGMRDSELEEVARDWYPAIETALLSNPTLNGTVQRFGTEGEVNEAFTMRSGHLHYFTEGDQNADRYVGIEVSIPVTTLHEFEEDFYEL